MNKSQIALLVFCCLAITLQTAAATIDTTKSDAANARRAEASKDIDNRKYKFLVFSESCFETYFTRNDFFNLPCLKLTISKLLGLGIVVFSTILKVPQILKIVSNKSVEGLSYSSIVFETTLYLFTVSYNLVKQNPFSLYGESVFIIIQNVIIMGLFAKYGKQFKPIKFIGTLVGLTAISAPLLLRLVPTQIFEFTLIINFVVFLFSRVPQIYSNFVAKSTGQLSAVTVVLNFAGAIARTFTIFAEKPDPLVLTNSISSVLLNGIILSQVLLFWNKKVKKE